MLHDASTQIARVLPIPRVKLSAKPDLVGLYSNIPAGAAAHKFEGGWWVLGPRPHTSAGQKVAASQGQRKLAKNRTVALKLSRTTAQAAANDLQRAARIRNRGRARALEHRLH